MTILGLSRLRNIPGIPGQGIPGHPLMDTLFEKSIKPGCPLSKLHKNIRIRRRVSATVSELPFAVAIIVVPLGIARNAFRILFLAILCFKVDVPDIDSPIHHHRSPIFFVLSFIPFGIILFFLHRYEIAPCNSSPAASRGLSNTHYRVKEKGAE
jgi:hypothetical protein